MQQTLEIPFTLLMLIPFALSGAHLLALNGPQLGSTTEYIRSFTAGFSVAYVFLLLLPELPYFGIQHSLDTALWSLVGFTVFHEAHKYIFQQETKNKLMLLDEAHLVTAGFYNFLIIFFLVELTRIHLLRGIVVTAIILFHTALSELSQAKAISRKKQHIKLLTVIATTLIGGFFAISSSIPPRITTLLFSFTAGAIVYIAIREEIPNDEKGRPLFFAIGVLSLIIMKLLFL